MSRDSWLAGYQPRPHLLGLRPMKIMFSDWRGGGGKLLHILKLIITHNDVLKNEADTGTNDDLEAYEFPIV